MTPAREVQGESLYPPESVKFWQAFPGSVPGTPGPEELQYKQEYESMVVCVSQSK
jgi:hypothetical protein